jgi:hypothetical protein
MHVGHQKREVLAMVEVDETARLRDFPVGKIGSKRLSVKRMCLRDRQRAELLLGL